MKQLALLLSMVLFSMSVYSVERYTFQVILTSDLVSDEIDATDYDAAIKILEGRARDTDSEYVDDELATLCGLYVLTKQLVVAHNTCNAAVDSNRSYAAYNNRGVLRAHRKDLKRALDDFARARLSPDEKQYYINELIKSDVRLSPDTNYAECLRYAEDRKARDPNEALSERTKGAKVEEIIR